MSTRTTLLLTLVLFVLAFGGEYVILRGIAALYSVPLESFAPVQSPSTMVSVGAGVLAVVYPLALLLTVFVLNRKARARTLQPARSKHLAMMLVSVLGIIFIAVTATGLGISLLGSLGITTYSYTVASWVQVWLILGGFAWIILSIAICLHLFTAGHKTLQTVIDALIFIIVVAITVLLIKSPSSCSDSLPSCVERGLYSLTHRPKLPL